MQCNLIFFIFSILLLLFILKKSNKLKGGNIKNFSDIDIYFINLNRSKDRLEHINTQLNINNLTGNRFAGVDGKLLDNNIINRVNESCINNGKRKLLKGEIGCYFSHINLWKEWKHNNNNNNKLLIVEDDIIFVENFNKKLKNCLSELPKDWDVLLLGWNKRTRFKKHIEHINISENLQKTVCPTFGCTGYMINKSFIDKIKKYTKIENIYMPIDFLFHDVDIDLNIYNSKEKIIISKLNNISTIDRPAKWINSPHTLDKPQHTLIKGGNKILKNSLNNYFIMKNNFDLHKNQILVSCSFFLTKTDSIRRQNKYIDGLKQLYEWTNKNKYILRIYYDNSVENIINQNYQKNDVQLFKYHFTDLFDNKLNKHFGTLGTLFRFLPLFDFENHYHNMVLVSDIDTSGDKDISSNFISYIDLYLNLSIKNNNDLLLISKYMYKFRNRFLYTDNPNNYPYLACIIFSNNMKALNINIFLNFFNKYFIDNESISHFNNNFQYGIDEYFLNNYMFNDQKFNSLNHIKLVFFEKHIKHQILEKIPLNQNINSDINNLLKNKDYENNIKKITNIVTNIYQKYKKKNIYKNTELLKAFIENQCFINFFATMSINNNKKTYNKV